MIGEQEILNRSLSGGKVFLNRFHVATQCGTSVGRIKRALLSGRLTADASDYKRAPLFAVERLPELKRLFSQ